MDSELTSILKSVKQKTGIDIDAYAETMKFSATTREEADWVLPSETSFNEIYADEKCGKTFFNFRFRNAKLIGSINGTSPVEKNYAYFIMSILDSSGEKENDLGYAEQMKSIVFGDYTRQQIQKFMRKFSVPDVKCCALVISNSEGKTEAVATFVSRYAGERDCVVLTDDMCVTLVKFLDGSEQFAPEVFARALVKDIKEETGISVRIGVGEIAANLLEINNAYVQATNALRMSTVFSVDAAVHSYKDYLLVKMLEDVPKFKLGEYLDMMVTSEAKAVFRDADMFSTAEAFLENDLNVSETSRILYMHRNTLIYRLDKIQRETKLDIRKFSDALTFRLISIMMRLIG